MRRRRRFKFVLLALVTAAAAATLAAFATRTPRVAGPMPQDVYVWQRAWTEDLRNAVRERARHFSTIVVLGAQIWWTQNHPRVARVPIDWDSLKSTNGPIALALRINPLPGPFDTRSEATQLVCDVAARLLADAREHSLDIVELQIDFDAAESKLDGYRRWIEALRARIAPTPVAITALPGWLDAPAFESLARAAGRYVLQVHSFERPRLGRHMTLCDPAAARVAVERAGRIGVPFRVALPTYGYTAAFAPDGTFLGLSAEGRPPNWPADAIVREIRADAPAMAELVRHWTADRPAAMTGIIWYRLPIESDTMNWRWPTLAAAMRGRAPQSGLRVETRVDADGVTVIDLFNAGEADQPLALSVNVSSQTGELISADAHNGFTCAIHGAEAHFDGRGATGVIGAGDRRAVGWVRNRDGNVTAHVER
jgi:hypothetical protein